MYRTLSKALKPRICLCIVVVSLVFIHSHFLEVLAQVPNQTLESDVFIETIPRNPEPLEPVSLEIKSYTIDVTGVTITWKYNNTTVASGIGKTRITTTAPASGIATITATITGPGVPTSTASTTIASAGVDILWEAVDAYTPPFYKGKALAARNSVIRTTAVQSSSAPKNLSFEWTRNDTVVSDASGYNRNSFLFKNETLQSLERIGVSANGYGFTGSKDIVINPVSPSIVLYETSEGFTNYASGTTDTYTTFEQGINLTFEPYYFSIPSDISSALSFDMKNGDNMLFGDGEANEISISRPDTGSVSILEVSATTLVYSLQNAIQKFTLLFL